jgi:hypothetical protein
MPQSAAMTHAAGPIARFPPPDHTQPGILTAPGRLTYGMDATAMQPYMHERGIHIVSEGRPTEPAAASVTWHE